MISSEQCTSPDIDDETTEALENLLSDTDGVYSSDLLLDAGKKKHFIKLLQPHRELPSKDWSKRFMAGLVTKAYQQNTMCIYFNSGPSI